MAHGSDGETRWRGRYIEAGETEGWEFVRRAGNIGAAIILAETDEGEILLVEQYRVPVGARCIELPAGLVGDEHSGEAPEEAARRELEEETGYRAGRLEQCGEFVTTPGMAAERFTLFRARDLVRTGPGGGVAGEDIAVHLVARRDLPDFLGQARARGCAVDKILAFL